MNEPSLLTAAVAALLAVGPLFEAAPVELRVAIVADRVEVPLTVLHRFTDVSGGLPEVLPLPTADGHAAEHDAHTYCFVYGIPSGVAVLLLHDSDFGMHTAQLSRSETVEPNCGQLSAEVYILVGEVRYSLSGVPTDPPPGFSVVLGDGEVTYERKWTESEDDQPGVGPTCDWRSVSVTVEYDADVAESITVQNWSQGVEQPPNEGLQQTRPAFTSTGGGPCS